MHIYCALATNLKDEGRTKGQRRFYPEKHSKKRVNYGFDLAPSPASALTPVKIKSKSK